MGQTYSTPNHKSDNKLYTIPGRRLKATHIKFHITNIHIPHNVTNFLPPTSIITITTFDMFCDHDCSSFCSHDYQLRL